MNKRIFNRAIKVAATLMVWVGLVFASRLTAADLTQLSIEDLMQVKVLSATKTEQTLQQTAAAVYVVTADDIRRSGATTIPEALQLVPGVEVARIDASHWAVTIRGFKGRFANKLLVLIDGRSIYNSQFSGVYWENENLFLPDIEQIEVIRGPGGALWGANAVNGVINIITKTSAQTQGGLLSLTSGNEVQAIAGMRYGGKLSDSATYRLYGQFRQHDSQRNAIDHSDGYDDWRFSGGGFRVDWDISNQDKLVVDSDLYDGRFKQDFLIPSVLAPYLNHEIASATVAGGNARLRWERQHSPTLRSSWQASYQYLDRQDPQYEVDSRTFDLDFQQDWALANNHSLIWGWGYRHNTDQFNDTRVSKLRPAQSTTHLYNAFVQDQIDLLPEQLRLATGVKIEHNSYTGWEWQPSLRLLWTPHPRHRLWTAVSRAVRTPSRGEQAVEANLLALPPLPQTGNLPTLFTVFGPGDLKAEKLVAYEAGYRGLLTERLSLDAAVFYNDYDQLILVEPTSPSPQLLGSTPYVSFPLVVGNAGAGYNVGFELAVDWRPLDDWRLRLAYSHSHSDIGQGVDTVYKLGQRYQFSVSSAWTITPELELDVWWRYVNGYDVWSFSTLGTIKVDPLSSLNFRLGWHPHPDLELSLVGTNLLDRSQLEFAPEALTVFPVAIERSIYGQIKWSF